MDLWQPVAIEAISVVTFLVGGFFGNRLSDRAWRRVKGDLEEHEAFEGHPVLVERVGAMKKQLDRIEGKVDRILNGS